MKIKLLCLILIIMGVLATSGCVDSQAKPGPQEQLYTYVAPADLYRSIFYPYAGLLNMPPHPHHDMDGLQDATLLLDENIKKAEIISSKIEPGVQYLKEQGKDVSRLEALLEEYNGLIDEAKYYRALAASAAGEEYTSSVISEDRENELPLESSEEGQTEINSAKDYLIQSQKKMIRASMVLEDIFEEFKRLMPGSVEINETAQLTAEGDGRVTLMGSFDINLHLEKGEVAIMELSPDSTINIDGNYTLEIKDGHEESIRIYHIQSADMEISGSQKTLLLIGENITVEAEGEGYAAFFGDGTYSVENIDGLKTEELWAAETIIEESMGPREPERTDNNFDKVDLHVRENGKKENY